MSRALLECCLSSSFLLAYLVLKFQTTCPWGPGWGSVIDFYLSIRRPSYKSSETVILYSLNGQSESGNKGDASDVSQFCRPQRVIPKYPCMTHLEPFNGPLSSNSFISSQDMSQ